MFTQLELEAAYKQMHAERMVDKEQACEVAEKLKELTGFSFGARYENQMGYSSIDDFSPYRRNYEVYMMFCDYDNWADAKSKLEKYCNIETFENRKIQGTFDIAKFPELTSSQKLFKVHVDYYDSHFGGW